MNDEYMNDEKEGNLRGVNEVDWCQVVHCNSYEFLVNATWSKTKSSHKVSTECTYDLEASYEWHGNEAGLVSCIACFPPLVALRVLEHAKDFALAKVQVLHGILALRKVVHANDLFMLKSLNVFV